MWDPIAVKSGCFKHPFKIYLHLKKKPNNWEGREVGVYGRGRITLLLVVFYISISLIISFRQPSETRSQIKSQTFGVTPKSHLYTFI